MVGRGLGGLGRGNRGNICRSIRDNLRKREKGDGGQGGMKSTACRRFPLNRSLAKTATGKSGLPRHPASIPGAETFEVSGPTQQAV